MRKIIVLSIVIVLSLSAFAQFNPVKWTFTSKKISADTYELRYSAKVAAPWHIYSQLTPAGGPLPTKISHAKNPMIKVKGPAKEQGKLLTKYEEVFGVDVKFFNGEVVFVQEIKLKSKVRTIAKGTIEFMVCNEEQCLPPAEVPFSIKL